MTDATPPSVLISAVLWLLALYHVVMGGAALFAPGVALRMVRALYGASLPDHDAYRYGISMLGALALVLGGLAAVAAQAPQGHRPIIAGLLVLQLCRAGCRIRDRRMLADSLRVSPARNWAAILVLGVESVVLGLGLR